MTGICTFTHQVLARPFVIANFVSTLDGVVSYEIKGKSGGATISGSDPADRFIMGLLRASADAVMVGAGTLRDISAKSLWTPESTYPDAKRFYAEYRVNALHKPEYPLLAIVSGSGQLELERAIFRTPAMRTVVITTSAGRDELRRRGAATLDSVEVHALNSSSGTIAPQAILELLQSQFGVKTVLNEGGPTLFGQFLAAEAIDELFLTLSPQIAGRKGGATRPAGRARSGVCPGFCAVVSNGQRQGKHCESVPALPVPAELQCDSIRLRADMSLGRIAKSLADELAQDFVLTGLRTLLRRAALLRVPDLKNYLAGLVRCARKHILRLARLRKRQD